MDQETRLIAQNAANAAKEHADRIHGIDGMLGEIGQQDANWMRTVLSELAAVEQKVGNALKTLAIRAGKEGHLIAPDIADSTGKSKTTIYKWLQKEDN